ncbi:MULTISPECIES: mucin-binding protein, partial [unclassified Lactobacillus]|uniref:mucin-binding protein n=1 Tax=unclassified Lactobacillus TaxID=2620435 RepID=UPI0018DE9E40
MKKSKKFYKKGKKFLMSGATVAALDFLAVNNPEVIHAAKVPSGQIKVTKRAKTTPKSNTVKLKKRCRIVRHSTQSKKVKKQHTAIKQKPINSQSDLLKKGTKVGSSSLNAKKQRNTTKKKPINSQFDSLKKGTKVRSSSLKAKKIKKQRNTTKQKPINSQSDLLKKGTKTGSGTFNSKIMKKQEVNTEYSNSTLDQKDLKRESSYDVNQENYTKDNQLNAETTQTDNFSANNFIADQSNDGNQTISTRSANSIHVDPNNYLNYFQQNGSAATAGNYTISTDGDGKPVGNQILTSDSWQAGNITFKDPIDLTRNFTLSGYMNFGTTTKVDNASGIADGIGFAFYTGEKNQVGKTGGNLGINGIPNAIGWKFDTWHNYSTDTPKLLGPEDDGIAPKDCAYGAFVTTDNTGFGSIDTSKNSLFTVPYTYINQGKDNFFTLNYTASNKTLTVKITINGQTYTSSKQIQFNGANQYLYFTISASTGTLPTKHIFKFKSFDYASKPQAIIEYHDLDANNKLLNSNTEIGTAGDKISHSKHDEIIATLNKNNYEVVFDGFTSGGDKVFNDDSQKFIVNLKHKTQSYIPGQNNPATGQNDDANLIKEVKQTIKYVGTPTSVPDNVQTVKFTREGIVDLVTQKTDYGPWNPISQIFKDVNSPEFPGYKPDTSIVKGTQVKSTDQDITITVKYSRSSQKTVIEYYDLDSNSDQSGSKMIASDTLYGNEGQKIPRDQHDRTISTLNQKGYQVVFDGFTNGGDKVYSDDSQKFIVNLKHFKQTYLPGENNPATGKNDDANLIKEVKQTIKYVGTPTPLSDNVQTVKFTREGTVDHVTKETTYGPWSPASNTFNYVSSPNIPGYEPDTEIVKGAQVKPTDQDITITVKYTKINNKQSVIEYQDVDDNNKV